MTENFMPANCIYSENSLEQGRHTCFLYTTTDALQKNMGLMHLLAQGYAEHAVSNCFLLLFMVFFKK